MTFKDLKKLVSLEATTKQQFRLNEILKDKPFWIWNRQEHKQEDIRTNGYCCFNHIIGLPHKDGVDKPLYDYEKIIFDYLVTHDGNSNSSNKHLWIKKATGLGISEFTSNCFCLRLLRYWNSSSQSGSFPFSFSVTGG